MVRVQNRLLLGSCDRYVSCAGKAAFGIALLVAMLRVHVDKLLLGSLYLSLFLSAGQTTVGIAPLMAMFRVQDRLLLESCDRFVSCARKLLLGSLYWLLCLGCKTSSC